jgi:hypothetical protein
VIYFSCRGSCCLFYGVPIETEMIGRGEEDEFPLQNKLERSLARWRWG